MFMFWDNSPSKYLELRGIMVNKGQVDNPMFILKYSVSLSLFNLESIKTFIIST